MTVKSLGHALEEARTALQRGTEWSAKVLEGWSSCLALLARLLHPQRDEARSSALALLDQHSRAIVLLLLNKIDGLSSSRQ
jgi:hypothetical protein